MFYIIIFAIILFFIWPVLRLGWKIYSVRRQMNRMFNNARSANTQRPNAGPGSTGSNPFSARRKKIDPSIGEYVEFEEVETTTQTEEYHEVKYERRQQVEDAEWEEIK